MNTYDVRCADEALGRALEYIGNAAFAVRDEVREVRREYLRPSVLYKPTISVDGNQWCALYGADLQTGVAGFGDTPAQAMEDFDHNWHSYSLVRREE